MYEYEWMVRIYKEERDDDDEKKHKLQLCSTQSNWYNP